MKSLKNIQVLCQVGKVLSRIVFICSIVGGAICLLSLVGAFFMNDALVIGNVTLHGLGEGLGKVDNGLIVAMASGWLCVCAGEAVLAKKSEQYFAYEIAEGTPFSVRGADKLQRLGILVIAVSVGYSILGNICVEVIAGFASQAENICSGIDCGGSVGMGIIFIIMSLFCRYGAEIKNPVPGEEN